MDRCSGKLTCITVVETTLVQTRIERMSTGGESSVPVSESVSDAAPVSDAPVETGSADPENFEQSVVEEVSELLRQMDAEDDAANAPKGDEPAGANEKPTEAAPPEPSATTITPVSADVLNLAQQWLGMDADTANTLGHEKVSGMLTKLTQGIQAQQPKQPEQPAAPARGPDGRFTKVEIKNEAEWDPDVLATFKAQQAELEKLYAEIEPLKQVRQTLEQQQEAQRQAETERVHAEFDGELVKLDEELFGAGKYSDVKIPEQKSARMEMAHKLETIETYYLQRQARMNLPVPPMSEMVAEAYRALHADRFEARVVKKLSEATSARKLKTTSGPSRKTGDVEADNHHEFYRQFNEKLSRIRSQPS